MVTYREVEDKVRFIKGLKEDLDISGSEAIELFKYLNGDTPSGFTQSNTYDSGRPIESKLQGYDVNKMLKHTEVLGEIVKNMKIKPFS